VPPQSEVLAEASREAVGGVFGGEGSALRRGGLRVDGVGFGGGAVGTVEEALEAVVEDEGRSEGFGEGRGLGLEADVFSACVLGEDQVFAGFCGGGGGFSEERHAGAGAEVVQNPNGIADDFPIGAEVDVFFGDEGAAEKSGSGENGEGVDERVPIVRDGHYAGAEVVPVRVDDDGVAEEHFGVGIFLKKFGDGGEGAGEVLVVGVEIGAEIASGTGEAAVDGVIHAVVGLGEDF